MIKLEHVSKSYSAGIPALNDVSLNIEEGEFVFVVGDSGSGKSTLIKVLGGIYIAEEGQIFIDGKQVAITGVNSARANGISIIHQELVLVPYMTVAENITMSYNLYNKNRIANAKRNRELASKIIQEIGVPLDLNAEVSPWGLSASTSPK